MGWSFNRVSSLHNHFNHDYYVSFTPDEVESGAAYYNYLDLVPKGRDEDEHPNWIRHHDKYKD